VYCGRDERLAVHRWPERQRRIGNFLLDKACALADHPFPHIHILVTIICTPGISAVRGYNN
jgi:hypothetical protein